MSTHEVREDLSKHKTPSRPSSVINVPVISIEPFVSYGTISVPSNKVKYRSVFLPGPFTTFPSAFMKLS